MRRAWEAALAVPQASPAVAGGRAARPGAGHPRRRRRPLPAHRRARRGPVQRRRPHPDALQRRRSGDGRLRHRAGRHPLGRGPPPRHLRVGGRDATLAPGRAAHRLGAAGRGHPLPAHQRQHGRLLHAPRRSRRRRRRRRPHRRQRRHRQQDRHLQRQRARQGARRAVLRGGAALDGRPHRRERRRDPHRGARSRPRSPASAGSRWRRRAPSRATRPSTSPRPPTSPPSSPRRACFGRRSGRRSRRPAAVGSAGREPAGAGACVPHGRGSRHAALSTHRADVQADGADPQSPRHGASAAPAPPSRRHRHRRQPALPSGQDPLVLRRRGRVRRRAALQPRGTACWARPAAPTRSASSSPPPPSSS